MMVGMVAYDVTLLDHAADDVWSRFHHVAYHEEGGGGVVFLQCVQNLFRVAVFVAAVKGQIDDLLRGVSQVTGVVLSQILGCGVADGSLSLCLKRQSPVRGRSRNGGIGGRGLKRFCFLGLPLKVQHSRQEQAGDQQHKKRQDAPTKRCHRKSLLLLHGFVH